MSNRSDLGFHFLWNHLADTAEALATEAMHELSRLRQLAFAPAKNIAGRYRVCTLPGISLVVVNALTRPLQEDIVAVMDNRYLLPSARTEARAVLLRTLGIASDTEAVTFHEICRCEYGCIHKNEVPIPIRTRDDLARLDISLRNTLLMKHLSAGKSLWWERWGGSLLSFDIDLTANEPFVDFEQLGVGFGRYKRIPASVVR